MIFFEKKNLDYFSRIILLTRIGVGSILCLIIKYVIHIMYANVCECIDNYDI